jgi:hypothetical protein
MSTILTDFFNRNDKTNDFLNDYTFNFSRKEEIINRLERTADVINRLKLKTKSYWFNKSNIFSLIVAIAKEIENIETVDIEILRSNLENFEKNIPTDYKLAAKEGVNNKNERELRNKYLLEIMNVSQK